MQRVMLKSKIHRATVSDCDLHYVGSITVDPDLLEAADIEPTARAEDIPVAGFVSLARAFAVVTR